MLGVFPLAELAAPGWHGGIIALAPHYGALTPTLDPTELVATFGSPGVKTTTAVAVTVAGGTGHYEYSWSRVSGVAFTINTPAANATTFTGTVADNQSLTGSYRLDVEDTVTGETGYALFDVTIRTTTVVIEFSPPSPLIATGTGDGTVFSLPVTATVTGGVGPFRYAWAPLDDDTSGMDIETPGEETTAFSALLMNGQELTGNFRLTVYDEGADEFSFADYVVTLNGPDVETPPPSIGAGLAPCGPTAPGAAFYTRMRDAVAAPLLARYANAVVEIRKFAGSGSYSGDPLAPYQTISVDTHRRNALVTGYSNMETDGDSIRAGDRKVLFDASGLTARPEKDDGVLIDCSEHTVISVIPKLAAGVVVLYEIQAREGGAGKA